jgi:hypothetical protein
MRLLRFGVVWFKHSKSIAGGKETAVGPVRVQLVKTDIKRTPNDDYQHFLFIASRPLSKPADLDDANRILIPIEAREQCEFAIEQTANIIAVFHGCERVIFSPNPCLALEWETQAEQTYLDATLGILANEVVFMAPRSDIPFDAALVQSLGDRLDGVTLLADAFAGDEMGRYREFVRFFELAFKEAFVDLRKRLTKFFQPTPFEYSRAEIDEWADLRHPSMHADMKQAQYVATATNVQRLLSRMEQAAIDVLFNKADWHSESLERRSIWIPNAFSRGGGKEPVVRQNSTNVSMMIRKFDAFDVYPVLLECKVSPIQDSWFVRVVDRQGNTADAK